MEYIEIKSENFSDVLNSFNTFHKNYSFRNNGAEHELQQLMENIVTDITIAYEKGDGFVKVEKQVLENLHHIGAFGGME